MERGPATEPEPPSTARGSATVAVWTLVSRVTGLLRVVAIGAVLGPTFFANAFLSANTVPNLTYTALAGPILALVLVPALVRSLAERGVAASGELLGRVSGYLLFWSGVAAAGLVLASPLVALAVTAGIPDADTRWRAWRLTVLVLVFVAPQVLCYTLAAIGAAVQQARGRFALAAAAPALENLGLVATVGLVALWFRPGVDVANASLTMVFVLGVGATASVATHAVAQLVGAWQVGMPVLPRRGWRADEATREVTGRLRRSVVVAAFPSVSMFGMLAVAATVPGGVFVFQAAMSVYFVIAALGAKAVTVAALPGMSAAADGQDAERFGTAWRQALSYSVIASLPALCLLWAYAEPVAATLANGRLHDPSIVRWLTACLVVFAIAQFADAVNEVARQALFARLDVTGPRYVSTVTLAVRLAVALGALALPAGGDRLIGLSCAVLLADLVAAALALAMVRAAIRPQPLLDPRRLTAVLAAAVAMVPAAVLGAWAVERLHHRVPQLVAGVALGATALACFGFALALFTGQLPTVIAKVRARVSGS
ncbi:murein biosynthesis integral membrane protein MurJ [Pseudonocardia acaciae]|uniref:murein biosynthesis integral membrane protein MurJ n=1 Tax=Pseudonocardia acaciae TaxID=551276 RepID=UPI00048EBACB|nr:lipid II flippase MurJ [Pseudonocardia acaciae]